MRDLRVIVGLSAGLVTLGGFGVYGHGVVNKNTRPNLVSWFIWLVLACILGLSYYVSGARQTALVSAACVIGDICIITISIKKGKIAWSKREVFYLVVSGLILLSWKLFNSPEVAQFASLAVHAAGAVPTFKKAWQRPDSENRLAWVIFAAGNLVNIFAIKRWAVEIYLYPAYLLLHSSLMVAFVFLSPKRKEGNT